MHESWPAPDLALTILLAEDDDVAAESVVRSLRKAAEIADCTSCAAASMSRLKANCIVIVVEPWALVEFIDSVGSIRTTTMEGVGAK